MIIELGAGSFVVYSPGQGVLASAAAIIPRDASVVLLAPGAGHSLGLRAWHEHFERSVVVAAEAALPRLLRSTSLPEIAALSVLADRLPPHISIHAPPGSATGEVWLRLAHQKRVYWLVCDSFMNIAALSRNPVLGSLQWLYGLRTGLTLGRGFRRGCEHATFRPWVGQRLGEPGHHVLVPCHGEIDEDPKLASRILALVERPY